jgi:hypothetical protein
MIKIHHLIQGTAPARNMLGSTGAATPLQKLQVLTGEALKMGLDGLNHPYEYGMVHFTSKNVHLTEFIADLCWLS